MCARTLEERSHSIGRFVSSQKLFVVAFCPVPLLLFFARRSTTVRRTGMRIGRSRVAALACAAVGSTAVGAYLLDPPYYDALVSKLFRKMSSSEKTEGESGDASRTSDLGAIRSLLATTSLREFLAVRHVGRPEFAPPASDVLVLTPKYTVSDALAKLAERSVVSAPLLSEDHKEILGFISIEEILGALITHMFPSGPCGYVSTHDAPEWFLNDDTSDAHERILRIVTQNADEFGKKEIGDVRRERGGDGAWLQLSPYETDDTGKQSDASHATPTLLDVIQIYFVDQHSLWKADSEHENKSNHRVAVYTQNVETAFIEITDVFSLSDVTRFLSRWEHIQHCLIPCTVADLGVGTTNVNVVETECTVLRAFAIMHKLGISALGVVEARTMGKESHDSGVPGFDEEFPGQNFITREDFPGQGTVQGHASPTAPLPLQTQLVGSISASDLRRITPGHFDVLAMTVGEFVRKLHDVSIEQSSSKTLAPDPMAAARAHPFFGGLAPGELKKGRLLVTCSTTATLYDVLKALASHKVHRVYAVDSDKKAQRIVTHTDLVKFFACFAPTESTERAAAGG